MAHSGGRSPARTTSPFAFGSREPTGVTLCVSPSGRAALLKTSPRPFLVATSPIARSTSGAGLAPFAVPVSPLQSRAPPPSAAAEQGPGRGDSDLAAVVDPNDTSPLGTTPSTPSRKPHSSPGRALLREFTFASPSPSPRKIVHAPLSPLAPNTSKLFRPSPPASSTPRTPGELLRSLKTLLDSAHLLPAGFVALLDQVVVEGTEALLGTRKGPSTLAHLVELGVAHQNSCLGHTSAPPTAASSSNSSRKRLATSMEARTRNEDDVASDEPARKKAARSLPPSARPDALRRTTSVDFSALCRPSDPERDLTSEPSSSLLAPSSSAPPLLTSASSLSSSSISSSSSPSPFVTLSDPDKVQRDRAASLPGRSVSDRPSVLPTTLAPSMTLLPPLYIEHCLSDIAVEAATTTLTAVPTTCDDPVHLDDQSSRASSAAPDAACPTQVAEESSNSTAAETEEMTDPASIAAPRRGPGRPKGSKTKRRHFTIYEEPVKAEPARALATTARDS